MMSCCDWFLVRGMRRNPGVTVPDISQAAAMWIPACAGMTSWVRRDTELYDRATRPARERGWAPELDDED